MRGVGGSARRGHTIAIASIARRGAPVGRLDEACFEERGADEVRHGGLLGVALARRLALQPVEAGATEAKEEQRVPG